MHNCINYWDKPELAPHWSWQWSMHRENLFVSVYVCVCVCVCVCVTIIHPRLSHPDSQDPCTLWNVLCITVYWRAHVCDLQLHALNWTVRPMGATCCLPWTLSTKTGRWMCRHMVYTDSAYWDSELWLPGNLSTHLCESDGLTVLLFCDVHIDIYGATLNLLKSACYLWM